MTVAFVACSQFSTAEKSGKAFIIKNLVTRTFINKTKFGAMKIELGIKTANLCSINLATSLKSTES